MRKQFNLQEWLKDKSQNVETRDGRIVHNIWPVKDPLIVNGKRAEVCALIDGEEDALMFFEGGRYIPTIKDIDTPFDLFIITPEPELTEFEQAVEAIYESCSVKELALKKKAAELLAIAIDANAKELYKGLRQSNLDKDSIPYHLIEFMCNLYTCRNWKEIEETAEAYVTRIKAAAMKDLPRWKKCEHEMHTLTHLLIRSIDAMWIGESVKVGQYYIPTNDLILKLPGFNE